MTPLTAIRLAEIHTEAGVPAGVFNVAGPGREIGQWLTEHPVIEKIFTGGVATGKKVASAASSSLKK